MLKIYKNKHVKNANSYRHKENERKWKQRKKLENKSGVCYNENVNV